MTGLIVAEALDEDLAAMLWLLGERGVPLVVGAPSRTDADELRAAVADLVARDRGLSDQHLPGRSVTAGSLEEILGPAARPGGELADSVRELGVVVIIGEWRRSGGHPVVGTGGVLAAHYIRPVERDAHGHEQRRPPAVLSARDTVTGQLDHFWWAITDELATRSSLEPAAFAEAHHARARLLGQLVAAGVVERGELSAHVARAALADPGAGEPSRRDAPH